MGINHKQEKSCILQFDCFIYLGMDPHLHPVSSAQNYIHATKNGKKDGGRRLAQKKIIIIIVDTSSSGIVVLRLLMSSEIHFSLKGSSAYLTSERLVTRVLPAMCDQIG